MIATGTALNMGGFGNAGPAGNDLIQIGTTVVCPILGCTDPNAPNYNPNANQDDGSCLAPMVNLFISEHAEGSSNNKYFEVYNPSNDTINLDDYAFARVVNAPSTVGIYEYWINFTSGAVVLPNDVYVVAHPSSDASILAETDMTTSSVTNGDDGYALVYGSQPATATHPDSGAYIVLDWLGDWDGDPGSGWDVAGVSAATANHTLIRKCSVTQGNSNSFTSLTGSAGTNAVDSEWEVFPSNTWTNIGQHTSPCPPVPGCTDSTATNYNPLATVDDSSCLYGIGCTDSIACNYDPTATVDDGSCVFQSGSSIDLTSGTWIYNGDSNCDTTGYSPYGITFNSDGTGTFNGQWPIVWSLCNDVFTMWHVGYLFTGNVVNGFVYGLHPQTGCFAITLAPVPGCTDPIACNYDPTANVDDGSCTYPGCTDPLALNYDSTAACDNGSCIYPPAPMVNLFFSEYAEGSSNNKYLEIYNPTSNDTVDLTAYAYPSVGNAPTTCWGAYENWNDFDAGAQICSSWMMFIL